jgi:short-chain fatty acids transporter
MFERYIFWVRRVLPSPLSIALILTALSFLGVWSLSWTQSGDFDVGKSVSWWVEGLWNTNLLVFAMQMMLMLVLGHTLARTSTVKKIIDWAVSKCNNTAEAALLVSLFSLIVGLFNWGLGLIFGAIFARKVAESFSRTGRPINYGLIGAAGYSALMIWHGGISGSALIKVAESGYLVEMMKSSLQEVDISRIPDQVALASTVFSYGNIVVSLFILILVPSTLYLVGKKAKSSVLILKEIEEPRVVSDSLIGAEKVDHSLWIGKLVGIILLTVCMYLMFFLESEPLNFFTPNNINLLLLALCFLMHDNLIVFQETVEEAMGGAASILIQFPIYFGIMGLISNSGLVAILSDYFISISSLDTYPVLAFLSAGLVNLFVPSGGGQWVIQGPILMEAALQFNVPLEKALLAFAYGDEITNMLQPFWAVPLLGITKLTARDILPFTLIMFLVGFLVYFFALLFIF